MRTFAGLILLATLPLVAQSDKALQEETLRHYQALVRMDTSDPPGNEAPAAAYLKEVLEKEGIPVKIFTKVPNRPNLVARLKGNGSKRPLLIMGHLDVVNVQPEKWQHPPFSAARDAGYVYGRGTLDDKDNVTANLMTMLTLKRRGVVLDRDVIFLAEAGEEGTTSVGIKFMVDEHFNEIEAEFSLAEGGELTRRAGKLVALKVGATEKIPQGVKIVAHGPAGHGSRPLQNNALLALSSAVTNLGTWQTPMHLNDITRTYFERLAQISSPEDAARYKGIVDPQKTNQIQQYFAANEPAHYSMLRTSITPTMMKAGIRVNVIPSEAEATLDIRATPDEDMAAFEAQMKKIINNPAVEIVRTRSSMRPPAPPSRLDTELFRAIETTQRKMYPGIVTLPVMGTGATDSSFLREKGMQSYGIGPMVDIEDGPKGYGAHSDQERLLESALYEFVQFTWEVVNLVAAH